MPWRDTPSALPALVTKWGLAADAKLLHVADSEPLADVASTPFGFVDLAREWLYDDAAARGRVEAYGRRLVQGALRAGATKRRPGEYP